MNDVVNGAFEILGFFFIIPSIRLLYRQKEVKGISPWHVGFFVSWGYWNLFYYPSLGQTLSFYGAGTLALANTVYLGQLLYYGRINEHRSV